MTGEDDEVYKKVGNVLFPRNRQETIQILVKEESYINDEMYAPFSLGHSFSFVFLSSSFSKRATKAAETIEGQIKQTQAKLTDLLNPKKE